MAVRARCSFLRAAFRAACGGDAEPEVSLPADATTILDTRSGEGALTSVARLQAVGCRRLHRQFESLALEEIRGVLGPTARRSAPRTVYDRSDGSRAVALAEVWLSNPVTGVRVLDTGYDIDRRRVLHPKLRLWPVMGTLTAIVWSASRTRREALPTPESGPRTYGNRHGGSRARCRSRRLLAEPRHCCLVTAAKFSPVFDGRPPTGDQSGLGYSSISRRPNRWVPLIRLFGLRQASPAPCAAFGSQCCCADDLTVVSTMLRPIIGDLGQRTDGLDDARGIATHT